MRVSATESTAKGALPFIRGVAGRTYRSEVRSGEVGGAADSVAPDDLRRTQAHLDTDGGGGQIFRCVEAAEVTVDAIVVWVRRFSDGPCAR